MSFRHALNQLRMLRIVRDDWSMTESHYPEWRAAPSLTPVIKANNESRRSL